MMSVLIWICDVVYILCVRPHICDIFVQSLWQHRACDLRWLERGGGDREQLRKLTLAHLNLTVSAAIVNGRHDNCLHYLSPVGDVCTLPLLSCQRISPLPWPRSTFKFVRNATAWLLHPTKRDEKKRKENRKKLLSLKVNNTKQHKTLKWTKLSIPDKSQVTTAANNVQNATTLLQNTVSLMNLIDGREEIKSFIFSHSYHIRLSQVQNT